MQVSSVMKLRRLGHPDSGTRLGCARRCCCPQAADRQTFCPLHPALSGEPWSSGLSCLQVKELRPSRPNHHAEADCPVQLPPSSAHLAVPHGLSGCRVLSMGPWHVACLRSVWNVLFTGPLNWECLGSRNCLLVIHSFTHPLIHSTSV